MAAFDVIRQRAYFLWEDEGRPWNKACEHWLRAESEVTNQCSYCFGRKLLQEFSYEHIWPDALGGDYLPSLWQTRNICERCNNLSGLFVDGEFIKSWFGSNERASSSMGFLDPNDPVQSNFPLHFLGQLSHPELLDDEVAEFWVGPCGAHVTHIRPKHETLWDTYAGGKPTRKRSAWGSAYLAVTTSERFWLIVSLISFHNHFRRADRVVVNMPAPQGFVPPFQEIDLEDSDQARKIRIARSSGDASLIQEQIRLQFAIKTDLGSRLLAKLALGVGRELLGEAFLQTGYAAILRNALWERDAAVRSKLAIVGTGYFAENVPALAAKFLSWPNAWTLTLWNMASGLMLLVGTPTGRIMTVLISNEPGLLSVLNGRFAEGEVYITIPALRYALQRPLALRDMIAHNTKMASVKELSELAAKRRDPALLPPCR
jgi:hypothetical protein